MTVTIDTFTPENLSFEKPRKNDNKYVSRIKYSKSDLVIQTPKVIADSVLDDTLEILVNDDNLYDFFGRFDEHIVNTLNLNANEWFSQDLNINQCQEIYKRTIHSPFKKGGNNRVFLKTLNTSVYNKAKESLNLSDIHKNDELICLIKCSQLFFYKSYCLPLWEVIQIKIKEKKLNTSEYIIRDVKDPSDDEDETQSVANFAQLNIDLKE